MVSGLGRRAQVRFVVAHGLSCRRACRLVGVARSTLAYVPQRPVRDAALLAALQRIARTAPSYGYRRAHAQLRREGVVVNVKRVRRLWRAAGFSQPRRRPRRKWRSGARVRPQAHGPNGVWTYDLIHDTTADGRPFKALSVVDEYTRECLALPVARSLPAAAVLRTLQELVATHGAPQYLRSDNGPEFVAHAVRRWLAQVGITTAYIAPGRPWQNGVAESFHSRLRAECLSREWFHSLLEAQVVLEDYRRYYNTERLHSSLAYQTPAEVGARHRPARRTIRHGGSSRAVSSALVR